MLLLDEIDQFSAIELNVQNCLDPKIVQRYVWCVVRNERC